jgi:hypothetical protein
MEGELAGAGSLLRAPSFREDIALGSSVKKEEPGFLIGAPAVLRAVAPLEAASAVPPLEAAPLLAGSPLSPLLA